MRQLVPAYWKCAVDAAKRAVDGDLDAACLWIDKMKLLVDAKRARREKKPKNEPSLPWMSDLEKSLTGSCLRVTAAAPEREWKPYFSHAILALLDMLENGQGDPRLELYGGGRLLHAYTYLWLGCVLVAAGDQENGFASAAVVLDHKEDAGAPPGWFVGLQEIGWGDRLINCDGLCYVEDRVYAWGVPDELWMCTECLGVSFCGDCKSWLKDGRLPIYRLCGQDHELVRVKPVKEEWRGVAAVLDDDGKIRPRKEWLDGIRREWSQDAQDSE
jgi:hypothetical protein